MKILVTGTAGFIGFHLVRRLLSEGEEVMGLDCINAYYDIRLKHERLRQTGIDPAEIQYGIPVQSKLFPAYRFVQLGLEDKGKIYDLFATEKFDAVCNLAAQAGVRYSLTHPDTYIQSNIYGFLNLLEACRAYPVKHLVYASSSSVYGLNQKVPFKTTDAVDHPVSLYAATKKSNEMMAHSYSHLFNIPTTGLRFFTVYGEWGRPDMALFLFTEAMLKGKPIQLFNQGNMVRDFTYVGDIVEGISRIIRKPAAPDPRWDGLHPDPSSSSAPYKIYNIGNSTPTPLMDYVKALEKALGIEAVKEYLPMQAGDVPLTHSDVSGLEKDFDYHPYTPIEEGVARFVEWYRSFYKES